MQAWREVYDGGSPEAEKQVFLDLAAKMLEIQQNNMVKSGKTRYDRTLHSKMVVGVTNASLIVDDIIPEAFRVLHFQPGATIPAAVRFSNASAIPQPDSAPDMRGIALKMTLNETAIHDFLLTSFPVSHARNARQFVDFASLAQGPRETFKERLLSSFGEAETKRMLDNIQQGARPCTSLAMQRFWSRGAILWGEEAVRFDLRPAWSHSAVAAADEVSDDLHKELSNRLVVAPVSFRLAVQRFVDEEKTPIEDAGVQWREEISAPIEIATLHIPCQNIYDEAGVRAAQEVDAMAFNPWNAPPLFRPLGNLNRVRGVVYGMSAQRWQHQS